MRKVATLARAKTLELSAYVRGFGRDSGDRGSPLPNLINALAPLGADVAPARVAQSGIVLSAGLRVATCLLVGMLHLAVIKSVFLTIGAG